jgi:hypothetical protein
MVLAAGCAESDGPTVSTSDAPTGPPAETLERLKQKVDQLPAKS